MANKRANTTSGEVAKPSKKQIKFEKELMIKELKHTEEQLANGEKPNVELALEDLLFGTGAAPEVEAQSESVAQIEENPESSENEESEDQDDDDLFFVDEGDQEETDDVEAPKEGSDEESASESSDEESASVRKPPASAWEDVDEESDDEIDLTSTNRLKKLRQDEDETTLHVSEYEMRLRDQFEKLNPKPLWAQGKVVQEDGEEVFRDAESLIEDSATVGKIPESTIDIQRLADVTLNAPCKGRITFTQFHPELHSHMIVGSSDHTLKYFQIDGKSNPHLHTLKFKDLSPEFGSFYNRGKGILFTGYRKHYYTVDTETNQATKHSKLWGHDGILGYFKLSPDEKHVAITENDGVINIMNSDNMLKMGNLKTNYGGSVGLQWSNDPNYLYSLNVAGSVFKWDLRTYRCIQMFNDEGGYKASHLGLSTDDQYLAIGSQSGFMNLYDVTNLDGPKPTPKPVKTYDHLTSNITDIKFNHDNQLMVMASSGQKNHVRLVHIPSRKVYANWPNPNQGGVVYKATSVEFSHGSAYLTIGNNMGKVALFRLNHYKTV